MTKLSKITAYVPVKGADFLIRAMQIFVDASWLDKRENVFVLSPAELEKLLASVWDNAVDWTRDFDYSIEAYGHTENVKSPDKETFLNQLINPV